MTLKKEVMKRLNIPDPYEHDLIVGTTGAGQDWYKAHDAVRCLVSYRKPKVIIEVGSYYGRSTLDICKRVSKENDDFVVLCIDTWLGETGHYATNHELQLVNGYPTFYWAFLRNLLPYKDHILVMPSVSHLAGQYLQDMGFKADLIFIDCSHMYDDVLRDLKTFWPLVNEGGHMFGDDYTHPDVLRAVREFSEYSGMETTKIGAVRVPKGFSATDPDIAEKLKGVKVKEITRTYIFQKEYEAESITT